MLEIEAEELRLWSSNEDRSRYAFFLWEMVSPFNPDVVFPPGAWPDGDVGLFDVALEASFSGRSDERITFRGAAAASLPRPAPADLKLNLGLGAKLDLNSWSCSCRDLIV